MNTDSEEVQVVEISPDIIYQQDKAQIDVQISTAKAYPRNITRSISNAIAIVTMDQETAETCTYSVPRGGRAITGPSVHLARILAQVWGNMRIDAKVVGIEEKQVIAEAICFDLETNLAVKVASRKPIVGKHGRYNDDMITTTGSAATAIAYRNAVFNVIPRGIVDKVYRAAKQTITGDVSEKSKLIAKRKQVFDAFRDQFGLTETEILKPIGKAAMDFVTADDLVVLIGIGTSIKEGETTVESAFKNGKDSAPVKSSAETEVERVLSFIEKAESITAVEQILKKCSDELRLVVQEIADKKKSDIADKEDNK